MSGATTSLTQTPVIDFLGIGAQKCGTTWLFEQLRAHPQLSMPSQKEVHFWSRRFGRGLEWYESLFSERSSSVKYGEMSPSYGILPVKRIRKLYEYAPEVKLIYLVRDPIARAWSSAMMALNRAELKFEEASDQWFIDHFHSQGSLQRGDYETCVDNWLEVFPSEQLLILDFKDIVDNPLGLLVRCCQHLAISEEYYLSQGQNAFRESVNTGKKHSIRPALQAVLEELYAEKRAWYQRFSAQEACHVS